MSYHLRVQAQPPAFCFHADTLDEFMQFLRLFGIDPRGQEVTTMACEQCGHLTRAAKRTTPET